MSTIQFQPLRRAPQALVAILIATSAHAGHIDRLPNNVPFLNPAGTAATFSTQGFVDLSANEFFQPLGSNGRACQTCHLVQAGWSVRPIDMELQFLATRGTAPVFNLLDANSPTADVSTVAKRHAAYSMLRKGLFRRGGVLPDTAEFEITAVDDPLKAGGSVPNRFAFFRRPLVTANFHIASTIGWHGQNTGTSTDVHAGLLNQAANTVIGPLQGTPPVSETTVESIADFQEGLRFAQQFVFGLGSLTSCGAQGGPENLSAQPPVNDRFNLFDAWIDLQPGSCTSRAADRKRAQIARGQELFNNPNGPTARPACRGCHSAQNNGSNVAGTLFNIQTSSAAVRKPGMPLYTLRSKANPLDVRETTDPGRALRTGLLLDLNRFKVPSLRGLAARAPYFHNGIAPTLRDVVLHYEAQLNFTFNEQEREDLVAFLEAL